MGLRRHPRSSVTGGREERGRRGKHHALPPSSSAAVPACRWLCRFRRRRGQRQCRRGRRRASVQSPHLRHQLRRRRAQCGNRLSAAALGRQLHHALQLAGRRAQHGRRLVLREHSRCQRPQPGAAAGQRRRCVRERHPRLGRRGAADDPDHRLDTARRQPAVASVFRRVLGGQVRRAAVDRPMGSRRRQWRAQQWHPDHRQRSARHLQRSHARVLDAVDRPSAGQLRHRRQWWRALLCARQRSDAVELHPPRRASGTDDL